MPFAAASELELWVLVAMAAHNLGFAEGRRGVSFRVAANAALTPDLIRAAVANVFIGYFENVDTRSVVEWFDAGGSLQIDENGTAEARARREAEAARAALAAAGIESEELDALAAYAVERDR